MTNQELINSIETDIQSGNISLAKRKVGNLAITCKSFSSAEQSQFLTVTNALKKYPGMFANFNSQYPIISKSKSIFTSDDFDDAVYNLKENLCDERISDVIAIGKALYGKSETVQKSSLPQHPNTESTYSGAGNDHTEKNAQRTYYQTQNHRNTSNSKNNTNDRNETNLLPWIVGGVAAICAIVILGKIFLD